MPRLVVADQRRLEWSVWAGLLVLHSLLDQTLFTPIRLATEIDAFLGALR